MERPSASTNRETKEEEEKQHSSYQQWSLALKQHAQAPAHRANF